MRRQYVLHALLFCAVYSVSMAYFYRTERLTTNNVAAADFAVEPAAGEVSVAQTTAASIQSIAVQSSVPTQPVASRDTAQAATTVAAASLTVDYSSPQSTFSSLESTAHSDALSENRLAAVESLTQLAANGDSNGQIREALRIATTDMDARVAEAARDAYARVSAWAAPEH